jgi:hypothetical protein
MLLLRVALMIGLTIAAWAQTDANKGQLLGTVTDPNGAVVPNATVTLKNTATGLTRELKTDSEGQYRAVLLDPGSYEVTAQSQGFATSTVTGLVLTVGGSISADIRLQLQSTTTTVEVGDTLIQIALPQPTTTLNSAAITNLPILGRRFHDFATLTPTVQVDPQRQQLSFVGQRGIYSNVMLDGADYNAPFFGGIRGGERSNFAMTVPQGAIQEFQTVTTGYSAEYGRSTGGVLNAITKSGANDVRGEAFYQIRHKEMGLKHPIANVLPNETLQQFGGNAGGPIKRDKLFWFGAIEQQYSRIPRRVQFNNLPAAAAANTTEAYNFFRGMEEDFKQTNDATALTGRVDYQSVAGNRLTVRYNFSNNNAENAATTGGSLNPLTNNALSSEGTEKNRTHTGTAQYTHLFSPTVINDIRFATTYELRPRLANAEQPSVSASILGVFGSRNFLPTTQDDTRIQIVDGLSISRGDHTLKLGFDYNRLSTFQAFGFNQFGGFVIAGSNINTILDIMSAGGDVPNRFGSRDVTYQRQIGNLLADFGMHQFALYGQDSWRVAPNLTIDLGIRWEAQWNPEPEANNTNLVNTVASATFPLTGSRLDPTKIPDALKQVMPRFGFAWSPGLGQRRLVVRGHTGLFYGATPMIVFAGQTNNFRTPPGNISITLAPTATQTVYDQLLAVGVDLNRTPLTSLPIIPIETVQRAATLAAGGVARDPFAGAGLDIVSPDFENPRAFQAGLGVESELFNGFVAGLQLNYVNTVHLMRNRDWNLPLPTIRPTDAAQRPFYGLRSGRTRPIPTLGPFTVRESSARSMYRGATFQTQYRVKRYQFGAFYTLSETFSDSDLERDAGGVDFDNAANLIRDYNYSRLDARHQFVANTVVNLPLDFELSAIFRARSGFPLNALTGADTNEDLFNTDRPYAAPGLPFERHAFRNRSSSITDMRVMRNFRFGEVRRIQLSAEFFNLFNQDNVVFNSFTGGGTVTTYGLGLGAPPDARFQQLRLASGLYNAATTTQVGTPLQIQFGLRFFF